MGISKLWFVMSFKFLDVIKSTQLELYKEKYLFCILSTNAWQKGTDVCLTLSIARFSSLVYFTHSLRSKNRVQYFPLISKGRTCFTHDTLTVKFGRWGFLSSSNLQKIWFFLDLALSITCCKYIGFITGVTLLYILLFHSLTFAVFD